MAAGCGACVAPGSWSRWACARPRRASRSPVTSASIPAPPAVTWKLAATLDGKIADAHGGSRWITSAPARRYAHRLRARADVVVVGAGTVAADDPR